MEVRGGASSIAFNLGLARVGNLSYIRVCAPFPLASLCVHRVRSPRSFTLTKASGCEAASAAAQGDVTAVMESVTVAQPPVRQISFRWCADGHRNHSWSAYVLPSGAQLTAEHVSELREQARHTYVDLGLRVSSIEDGTASTGLMRPVKPHAIWPGY